MVMRVEAIGDHLSVLIDGEEVFTHGIVDSDLDTGTVGLQTWGSVGAVFDDLIVIRELWLAAFRQKKY